MDFVRGNLAGVPQDPSLVTYAKKIEKNESALDWTRSARELHDRVRAFVWGPGTYGMLEGKRLKIHRTRVASASGRDGDPGEVLTSPDGGLRVACADGQLELLEVQPESRNRQSAADFRKTLPAGAKLVFQNVR
jgi:methionyl-tRNA formyltransferase